ncbi:unnamed protein product [Rhizopus stolonifer]
MSTRADPTQNNSAIPAIQEQLNQFAQQMNNILTTFTGKMEVMIAGQAETRDLLASALRRIQELETRLARLDHGTTFTGATATGRANTPHTTTVVEQGTEDSIHATRDVERRTQPTVTFAAAAAKAPNKSAPSQSRRTTRPIPIDRAIRLFQPPSPTTGYQFIYLNQKGRLPMNEIRRSLSSMGVNNSRILDIHFPARNVCGLLVHNDFVPTLTEALQNRGITPITSFNPCDPSTIKDPKYQTLPTEERASLARDTYKGRILRIITRAPIRIRTPLLASFQNTGIITRDDWTNHLSLISSPHTRPQNTHIVFPTDEEMDEDTPNHETAHAQ